MLEIKLCSLFVFMTFTPSMRNARHSRLRVIGWIGLTFKRMPKIKPFFDIFCAPECALLVGLNKIIILKQKQAILIAILFSFKSWLDQAHLRIRWKLGCNSKSWREMIEKRLGKSIKSCEFILY